MTSPASSRSRSGTSGADGRVQILDGLKEGDVVIVHSESEIAADARIKVVSSLTGSCRS
jgi:HlyD family secretion protein